MSIWSSTPVTWSDCAHLIPDGRKTVGFSGGAFRRGKKVKFCKITCFGGVCFRFFRFFWIFSSPSDSEDEELELLEAESESELEELELELELDEELLEAESERIRDGVFLPFVSGGCLVDSSSFSTKSKSDQVKMG